MQPGRKGKLVTGSFLIKIDKMRIRIASRRGRNSCNRGLQPTDELRKIKTSTNPLFYPPAPLARGDRKEVDSIKENLFNRFSVG